MATASWSNVFDMTTDAGFRVIGSAISSNFSSISPTRLVQTADTGQINWTTVTKPVTSPTAAGYEIWAFTDSTGQTLYYKIEYGTNSYNATSFGMWVTVGLGTNGAGTITGVIIARTQVQNNQPTDSTGTNYFSYACCTDGAFWLVLGYGAATGTTKSALTAVFCARTCDSSGNVTSDGFEWIFTTGNAGTTSNSLTCGCYNNSTGYKLTTAVGAYFCFIPYGISASATAPSVNYQAFRHELPLPQNLTTALAATYLTAEAGFATTYSMALVGTTPHTFFFCGSALGATAVNGNTPATSLMLVYE